MTDQADKLRTLVQSAGPAAQTAGGALPMIVVTGARAGVGASTVALNLAAVMADRDERVLLVDGSQHAGESTELGRPRPDFRYALADVLAEKCGIEDAIVPGPAGVSMLLASGRNAPKRDCEFRRNSPAGRDFSRRAQDRLLGELQSLEGNFDLIVVDAGRGLTPWSRRFWSRAKLAVLVTTANDAAVLDAYAVLKESAAVAADLPVRLLVNQAAGDPAADDVERRLEHACQRFLSRSIPALPALPRHMAGGIAEAHAAPRVWEIPNSVFGHAVLWLGRTVSDVLAGNLGRCRVPGVRCQEIKLSRGAMSGTA
jgi:flagellar biosynthesis protein FlhG